MKRLLPISTTIVAVAYFGFVRESEARCLRHRAAPTCQPACCATPCSAALAIAAPSAPAAKPPSVEPPKPAPSPPAMPPIPKPLANGKLHLLLLIDDAGKSGGANKAGAALFAKMVPTGSP